VFSHSFASHQVADWKCILWDVPRLTLSSKNYLLGKTSFIYISERNYWPGRNIQGVEDVKSLSLAQVVRSKMYLTFPKWNGSNGALSCKRLENWTTLYLLRQECVMNMFTIRLGWSDVMTNDDEIYKWRHGC